jgi:predicted MFS family arabinose efflux permease
LLLAGGVGLSLGLGGLALAGAWTQVAAIQVLLGLAFYMFHGVLQVRATEALPEARGTAVGAFALALFLGQGVGSLVFGLGLSTVGYRGAFAVAGAGVLALAAWARQGMR